MIQSFRELRVFQAAFRLAMEIFDLSKSWPGHERFELTSQIRRSSRSVCACITEAWRKRRYPAAFVAKLNDAETEASETRLWLDFALACGYLSTAEHGRLDNEYDRILGQLVRMIRQADDWAVEKSERPTGSRPARSGPPLTVTAPKAGHPSSPHQEPETKEGPNGEPSAARNIPPSSGSAPKRKP